MRPYLLIENNWKNLSIDRHDLAVMSWGATEAHNYHLPYGTDVYEADAISTESARKAYEKGGKVKKMKSGGKIRGYGMARGGKACKMR